MKAVLLSVTLALFCTSIMCQNILDTMTPERMAQMMPGAGARAQQMYPHLMEAMRSGNINTPARVSSFLAQLGHESGSFRYMQELASGKAYEGRRDLGNTQPGDGERFKGRGPIQITGRANYQALSKALGHDFVANPQDLAKPEWGFKAATWFWNTRNLNSMADKGDFNGITKRINGGYNGKADRDQRLAQINRVLGSPAPAPGAPAGTNPTNPTRPTTPTTPTNPTRPTTPTTPRPTNPTTPRPTTPRPTNPTTPRPTTPRPTTPRPTTPRPTTPRPTTPRPTTPRPTTPRPSTPRPTTPRPSTPRPTPRPAVPTPMPSIPRPSTPSPRPSTPRPSTPSTPRPSAPAPRPSPSIPRPSIGRRN